MYNFTVNPKAGSGKDLKVWKAIACYMESHNIEYGVFLIEGTGDARTAAMRLTDNYDEPRYIIAVGGDGTMDEVLDDISFHGSLSLGYILASSGNDLARGFRVPGRTTKCPKKQPASRHFTTIDYGAPTYGNQEVSHRRFLVSAGIGFDAAVCRDVLSSRCRQRSNRLSMRRLFYVLIGMHQFFKCKSCKGYVSLDGVREVEFNNILFISCHIQSSEGGGLLFAPRADGSDGKLNICVMSHGTRTKLIPVLLSALMGRCRPKGVRTYERGEVSIHTEATLPAHADGEGCGFQTDIQASCIARKVRMIIWRRQ